MSIRKPSFGGDAGSGVIGVSGDVGGDALELHGEHSEVEDLDEGEFSCQFGIIKTESGSLLLRVACRWDFGYFILR